MSSSGATSNGETTGPSCCKNRDYYRGGTSRNGRMARGNGTTSGRAGTGNRRTSTSTNGFWRSNLVDGGRGASPGPTRTRSSTSSVGAGAKITSTIHATRKGRTHGSIRRRRMRPTGTRGASSTASSRSTTHGTTDARAAKSGTTAYTRSLTLRPSTQVSGAIYSRLCSKTPTRRTTTTATYRYDWRSANNQTRSCNDGCNPT